VRLCHRMSVVIGRRVALSALTCDECTYLPCRLGLAARQTVSVGRQRESRCDMGRACRRLCSDPSRERADSWHDRGAGRACGWVSKGNDVTHVNRFGRRKYRNSWPEQWAHSRHMSDVVAPCGRQAPTT
jgi:hypothetical protein